ncbi:MAG: class I tRNA ligase family protein, partial [Candidatus Aenigmarchaeota archaeon]|nr:class I tRNA ligase family protein [Candidatus Aenigmarchaeota archaeon]
EFVKYRIYDEELTESKKSALFTLNSTLFDILKMFAPFTPFVTEEIYQLYFNKNEMQKSIHLCNWSQTKPQKNAQKCLETGDLFCEIISQIRQYKNQNSMSLKTELKQVKISLKTKKEKELIEQVVEDIKGVGKVENVDLNVNENQEENTLIKI